MILYQAGMADAAIFTDAVGPHWGSYKKTDGKIMSFERLPLGWHYGKGGPASPHMVRRARGILSLFGTIGFMETDAFPGISGEIMVTAYRGKHCVEVTTELDNSFVVTHEFDGEDRFHETGLSVLQAASALAGIIGTIVREECDTSSWSTWNITTTTIRDDSKILRSSHPATALEHLSFGKNVASVRAEQYALTSTGITLESVGSLQFFGDSTLP